MVIILGAPVGLLWRAVAGPLDVLKTTDGHHPVDMEGLFAPYAAFVIIEAVAGWLVAIAVFVLRRRHRGPVVLAALAIGSVGGALVSAWLGRQIGLAHYRHLLATAPPGTLMPWPPSIWPGDVDFLTGVVPNSPGPLMIQALTATATYTLMSAISPWPSLRGPDDDPVHCRSPGGPSCGPSRDGSAALSPPARSAVPDDRPHRRAKFVPRIR